MVIVLKCHDCGSADEPHNMYRRETAKGELWFCLDCYNLRRQRLRDKRKKPEKLEKVMSYKEQQKIHRARWQRFKKVVKSDGNIKPGRDQKNSKHE